MALVLVGIARLLPAQVSDYALRVIGVMSLLYVPRDIFSDTIERSHLRSDARMLAEEFGGGTWLWGGLWLLLSLAICYVAVRWSLKRRPNVAAPAADPNGGGFYYGSFDRVKSIEATGPKTVKITLTQPDYWLLGELSSTPGQIVKKAYVESKGKDFGTVTGGTELFTAIAAAPCVDWPAFFTGDSPATCLPSPNLVITAAAQTR